MINQINAITNLVIYSFFILVLLNFQTGQCVDFRKNPIKNIDMQGEMEKEYLVKQKAFIEDFQQNHQSNSSQFRQEFYQTVLNNILEQHKTDKFANTKLYKISNRLDLRYVITFLLNQNDLIALLQTYYIEFVEGKAFPKQFKIINEQKNDINILNTFVQSSTTVLDIFDQMLKNAYQQIPPHLLSETMVLLKTGPEVMNQSNSLNQLQILKTSLEKKFPTIKIQFIHKDDLRSYEKLAFAVDNGLSDFSQISKQLSSSNDEKLKQVPIFSQSNLTQRDQIISTIRMTWKNFTIFQINGFFDSREITRLSFQEQINTFIDFTIQNVQQQQKATDSIGFACFPIGYHRVYQEKHKLVGLGQLDQCRKSIQTYFAGQQDFLKIFLGNKVVLLKSNFLKGIVTRESYPKEINTFYIMEQAKKVCEITKAEMARDQQKFKQLGQNLKLGRIANRCFILLYTNEILNFLKAERVKLEDENYTNWFEGSVIHSLIEHHSEEAKWFQQIVEDYMHKLNQKTIIAQQDYYLVIKGTLLMMIVLMIIVIYGFYYYSKLGKSEPNGSIKNC